MQNVHHTLKLNAGLLKIAEKVRAEEIQAFLSKKALKKHWDAGTLSDKQVLEMRALKEFASWKAGKIATYCGVDLRRVYKILSYEQRSKLIPKRSDLPSI